MPTYSNANLIEIDRPMVDDVEILLSKVEYFNNNRQCLLPYNTEKVDRMGFVYIQSEKRKAAEVKQELFDVFGQTVSYKAIDMVTATSQQRRSVQTAKKLLSNDHCCGNSTSRFATKSRAEVLLEIDNLIGFGSFKTACHELCKYTENAEKLVRKVNYNVALIIDCKVDTEIFVELIFDLYTALGIIADPLLAHGDVDDAFFTDRNTAFLFILDERWADCGIDVLTMPELEKQLGRLCKRDTIYITVVDKVQYEKLQESDNFMRLFPQSIEIADITKAEKLEFVKHEAASYGFSLGENIGSEFALLDCNIEHIRSKIGIAIKRKLISNSSDTTLTISDFIITKKKTTQKTAYDELEELIGLSSVKTCIKEISAFLKNRGKSALPCLHMVFRGNPGTGKTTVARLIGKIFGEIGILKNPNLFVEADRNTLVSKYLGGTASQTSNIIKTAQGGVLFIDEAYALNNGEKYDYGNEAVAVLVKQMEDYRCDFVCIMAGYTDEMEKMLNMNPGLRERVQFYIDFPDYDASELTEIFTALCKAEKYTLNSKAVALVEEYFCKIIAHKDQNFANGRIARKVFERIRLKQALRSASCTITVSDVKMAFSEKDIAALCQKSNGERKIGFGTVQ